MNIKQYKQREKEIIREMNSGNTKNISELLGIEKDLCGMYVPCSCGFISKSKEMGLCKICEDNI